MITDLIDISKERHDPAALFAPGGLDDILERIETTARDLAPDATTAKGRKAIASLAAKIARSKTYLDGRGKEFIADLKAKTKSVDGERKRMRDRLDALKEEIRRPLTEYERREAERQAAIRERIAALGEPTGKTVAEIRTRIVELEAIVLDESWAEFATEAEKARDAALEQARTALVEAEEAERLQAERKAREEQERREREARIAAEAAARATREAEEKARRETERAEKEREVERRRQEQARLDAERRAEEAERQAAQAAHAERERIAAEQRRAAEEEARRAADRAHRTRIHDEITAELTLCGLNVAQARAVVTTVTHGKIPHLRIVYA